MKICWAAGGHCMLAVDPEYENGFHKYSVHDFIMILRHS